VPRLQWLTSPVSSSARLRIGSWVPAKRWRTLLRLESSGLRSSHWQSQPYSLLGLLMRWPEQASFPACHSPSSYCLPSVLRTWAGRSHFRFSSQPSPRTLRPSGLSLPAFALLLGWCTFTALFRYGQRCDATDLHSSFRIRRVAHLQSAPLVLARRFARCLRQYAR